MPIRTPDGVRHTTADSGTGDLTLSAAAVTGFRSADEALAAGELSSGETVYYVVQDADAIECGTATLTSDGGSPATWTLGRASGSVIRSTNGGSRISAAGGGATAVFFSTPEAVILRDQDRSDNGGTLAVIDAGQTFVGAQGITGDLSVTGDVTITDTDAGATAGPILTLHRNSASPADDDVLGSLRFDGEDDGSAQTTFAKIEAEAADVTNATEDGDLVLYTMIGGALTEVLRLGHNGGALFGATPQGPNTLNGPAGWVNEDGDAVTGGAWKLLVTETFSDVTAVDFDLSSYLSAYTRFVMVFDRVRYFTYTTGGNLSLRMGTGGGIDSGASDYRNVARISGTVYTAEAQIRVDQVFSSGEMFSGVVEIWDANDANVATQVRTHATSQGYSSTGTTPTENSYNGVQQILQQVDTLRVFVTGASDTMQGTIRLYGVTAA